MPEYAPARTGGTRHSQAAGHHGVELYTIPATAQRLRSSDMHIYRLIASGALRAVDIAQPGSKRSKTRVRSDDLAAYIEAHTRRAGAVPQAPATGPAA